MAGHQSSDEIRQRLAAAKSAHDNAEREVRRAASEGFMLARGEIRGDAAAAADRLARAMDRYHESVRAGNETFTALGGKPVWGSQWLFTDAEDEEHWQDILRRLREHAAKDK